MKITRAFRAAAVLAIGALALTACSSGGSQKSSSGDQTLNISISAPPSNFQIGNWSGGEAYLYTGVYDTIFRQDNAGDIKPEIAETWEYSTDRTKLTLHIRAGMKFSDGSPVDAAAVAASLNASRAGASTLQNLASVTDVTATDAATVVVSLSAPDASLVPNLAGTIGAVGATSVLTADSSKLDPVGSGPYILDKADTTVGATYVLTRNPDYWDPASYPFAKVNVKVLADATATQNALLSGQIDVIGTGITPAILKQYSTSKFNSGQNAPVAFGALWLVDRGGSVVPALADERVRKAINLVFDRDSIATNLTGEGSGPTNQVFNPAGSAFDKDLLSETPYNVDEAKSLMAAAGYASGFTVTMPSTVVSTSFEPTITQSLADINITVNWESVQFQDFYTKVLSLNYGMFFMYNGFGGNDAVDTNANISGIFNPFNTVSPELQTLLTAANSASEADQNAAYQAVNKYFVDHSWYAPLNYSTGFWVASKSVSYTPPVHYANNLLPFAPASN